jgi:uncharacterized protein (DUF427 family)
MSTQQERSSDPSRVTVDAAPVHVHVEAAGRVVADSRRGLVVRERGLPARYYVPADDVQKELVAPTADGGHCPFKGDWTHFDLRVGDQVISAAGWSYHKTYVDGPQIKDHLAFYPGKVELTVDGNRQT